MPYAYTFEKHPSRRGDWGVNATRGYKEPWFCLTDNPTGDPATIKAQFFTSTGITILSEDVDGEGVPLYVTNISAEEIEESDPPYKKWNLEVTYSASIDSGVPPSIGSIGGVSAVSAAPAARVAEQQTGVLPADRVGSPLLRPIKIVTSTKTIKVPYWRDAANFVYANSQGDPYDNAASRELPAVTYKIGRNYGSYLDWAALVDHVGKTNNANVTIKGTTWPAHCLKFESIDSIETIVETNESGAIAYDRFEFTLTGFKNPYNGTDYGWRDIRPNMGRRKFVTGIGLVPITDGSTQPITNPVYLTSAGVPIDTTVSGWESSIHLQVFQPLFTFNMSTLLT